MFADYMENYMEVPPEIKQSIEELKVDFDEVGNTDVIFHNEYRYLHH